MRRVRNIALVAHDAKMASMALGVNSLAIDPTDSSRVFAGTTKGLYHSTDQGEHWEKIGGDVENAYIAAVRIDPQNPSTLYLATSNQVQKSQDSGMTWEAKTQGVEATSIRSLQLSPKDSQILYIGTNGGGLYRSTDGGDSWNRLPLELSQHSL